MYKKMDELFKELVKYDNFLDYLKSIKSFE